MPYKINDRRYDIAKAVCDGEITGHYVKAEHGDGTLNEVDVACLDIESLRQYLDTIEKDELIDFITYLLTENEDD